MVYDSRDDSLKEVFAASQRKAIKKAASKYGVVPQRTDHARPRRGDGSLMSPEEFEGFMDG